MVAGIFLGSGESGDVTVEPERSVLVLGPSRSGKTSSIVIPNLLLCDSAVVATSTKDDVVRAVAERRREICTLLFDPSGQVPTPRGVTRVGYSPVRSAESWDGAILAARSLVESSRLPRTTSHDHWTERAEALVGPLLHATALNGGDLTSLTRDIDERRGERALDVLREARGVEHPSWSLLAGVLATEERELSGIWSSASGLMAGMRTEAAREAARSPQVDAAAFLAGGHQLHVVAPSRHQAVSVPLVVGLIQELVHATYDRHPQGARLLLALDEMANVAPLPNLPGIVSEGGGQGVTTLACLQDLSQARQRWGRPGEGFLSLFPTTVVLPGIADRPTLELIERLGGVRPRRQLSLQRDPRGRVVGTNATWRDDVVARAAQIARGRQGHAMVLGPDKSLRWVGLSAAHRDSRYQRARDSSRERDWDR